MRSDAKHGLRVNRAVQVRVKMQNMVYARTGSGKAHTVDNMVNGARTGSGKAHTVDNMVNGVDDYECTPPRLLSHHS